MRLQLIRWSFTVYAVTFFACVSSTARAQELAFQLNELDTALDLVSVGIDDEAVLFDTGLWSIVRDQVALHSALYGEYNAADFVLNMASPVSGRGLFEAQTLTGEIITFNIAAYDLFDSAINPHLSPDFRNSLAENEGQVAYVGGTANAGKGQVAFFGVVITATSSTSGKALSRLVITQTAALPDPAIAEGLSARNAFDSTLPDDTGAEGSTQRIVVWDCVFCAACFGTAGVSCAALCVDGYWDTPGEGFITCLSKCIGSVAGASPLYDVACFAACGICSGRSAVVKTATPNAPVPWEIFQKIQN